MEKDFKRRQGAVLSSGDRVSFTSELMLAADDVGMGTRLVYFAGFDIVFVTFFSTKKRKTLANYLVFSYSIVKKLCSR